MPHRPRPGLPPILGLALAALLAGAAALPAASSCPVDAAGEVRAVLLLLDRGDTTVALARAAGAAARCPGHGPLVRLLARTHHAAGDAAAARDLLAAHLAGDPLDCPSWSWLAWLHLDAGDPDAAWEALYAPGCPDTPELTARWAILEALAAQAQRDTAGMAEALARLGHRSPLWPEDDRARAHLQHALDPAWRLPWQTTLEVALGATSNALAGSPTDIPGEGESSALARLSLRSLLVGPGRGPLVPFGEITVRGHGIAADAARDLSYLELVGRAGVILRTPRTRTTLGLRQDALHLNHSIHSRYFTSLRAEADLELPGNTVLFAGGGRREFDDPWRTRREFDLGIARMVRPGGHPVTLVLAARRHDAGEPVYDLRGATLTAITHVPLDDRWTGRASLLLSRDEYPRSDTWQGLIAFGSAAGRRDTSARVSLGAWRRLTPAAQGAITYEYARRWSTIDEGFRGSFAFTEHRLLATIRLDAAANPYRRGRPGPDHVPLPYGLTASATGLQEERLRDLLRLDEELRPECPICP